MSRKLGAACLLALANALAGEHPSAQALPPSAPSALSSRAIPDDVPVLGEGATTEQLCASYFDRPIVLVALDSLGGTPGFKFPSNRELYTTPPAPGWKHVKWRIPALNWFDEDEADRVFEQWFDSAGRILRKRSTWGALWVDEQHSWDADGRLSRISGTCNASGPSSFSVVYESESAAKLASAKAEEFARANRILQFVIDHRGEAPTIRVSLVPDAAPAGRSLLRVRFVEHADEGATTTRAIECEWSGRRSFGVFTLIARQLGDYPAEWSRETDASGRILRQQWRNCVHEQFECIEYATAAERSRRLGLVIKGSFTHAKGAQPGEIAIEDWMASGLGLHAIDEMRVLDGTRIERAAVWNPHPARSASGVVKLEFDERGAWNRIFGVHGLDEEHAYLLLERTIEWHP